MKPTRAQLLAAIEQHRDFTYGEFPPNFHHDAELYIAAGLLPWNYNQPEEEVLEGTNYALRTALEDLLRVARPIGQQRFETIASDLHDAVRKAEHVLAWAALKEQESPRKAAE